MKLTPQKPAMGILQTNEYKDAKVFKVECSCQDPDHAVDMWIEVDADQVYDVVVSFYVTTKTPFWKDGFSRIKTAWQVLTTGIHKSENHLYLGDQAAMNLAFAINDNIKILKARRNDAKARRNDTNS